ncbi:MAG: hypothetical protein CMF39_00230 [Legionellaceae bacterium]|nr:hypothetical protein [Legionellaceae bacterium]
MSNNNNHHPQSDRATGKVEDLYQLIEKMIRNPEGEAVYFGSAKGSKVKMDRKHGFNRYV